MAKEHKDEGKWACGIFRGELFGHQEVNYRVMEGRALFEGDMVIGDHDEMQAERARGHYGRFPFHRRWPVRRHGKGKDAEWYAKIPWENTIGRTKSPALHQRVEYAIRHWNAKVKKRVRFERIDAAKKPKAYLSVVEATQERCYAEVGYKGRKQWIWLHPNCGARIVIHEVGHAIGLLHEHTRWDRNRYVRIKPWNVKPREIMNFVRLPFVGWRHGKYDYHSIMHYDRKAFSRNGRDTIVPCADVAIGVRPYVSKGDIAAVLDMYDPGGGGSLPGY